MEDEVTFDAPAPKPAKKRGAKKKPAAKKTVRASAAPKQDKVPYPGLTRTQCANSCGTAGCTISGRSYCAHPTKGGLQASDMSDTAALKRLQAARDQIDVKVDPDRFKGG